MYFFFFFFFFENIVDSPLNQSRNTREKRALPTLQTKSTYSTVQVKEEEEEKNKKKTLYPEYRRFVDFHKTLGIKPSKRNIRQTTLASPRKVCVMQSCAKLLGIVMLYPETIFLAKLCEIPRVI